MNRGLVNGSDEPLVSGCVWLRPDWATVWNGPEYTEVPNPCSDEGRKKLRKATKKENTVWLETSLASLTEVEYEWFSGSLDIWKSMPNPEVDWTKMRAVLKALGIEPPKPCLADDEPPTSRFLRALPYVYTRGVLGTIRDVAPDDEAGSKLEKVTTGDRLTAFPAVGFLPDAPEARQSSGSYVTLRMIVAVVKNVVITVRLPDRPCGTHVDHEDPSMCSLLNQVDLIVPRRFLPLRAMPSGRQLAESIGIHQATTARGVSYEIRKILAEGESEARGLTSPGRGQTQPRPQELRRLVRLTAERADRLSEIAQELDQTISLVLRRFGGVAGDTPPVAENLAPPEVERRYDLARDEVRSLYKDCRLASQIVRQALADYNQKQAERFQFFAGFITSVVLIPTLIASLFGANVEVPTEKDNALSFVFLVAVSVGLVLTSLWALWKVRNHGWNAPLRKFVLPVIAAIAIVAAFIAFLIWS